MRRNWYALRTDAGMIPPRAPAFAYLGHHRYFVTCCTFDREDRFRDAAVVAAVRSQILRSAETYHVALVAYVFMPDHVHLLVEGRREDADFRLFMRNWRKRSAFAAQAHGIARLWQKGFFDRVLREEQGTEQVINYMLNNPVRAGLVANLLDYPFLWSLVTHAGPP